MSVFDVLLTGFALSMLGLCAFYAWNARESALRAAHSEHRLAIMRGQVSGLEASLMGLETKFNKLAGRVYADEYWRGKNDKQAELQPTPSGDVCENWQTAQRDGPSSPAAGCECAYCNARREDRARRRANLRVGVKS